MKVSIIIPVYNVYQYIRECVESVQKLKTDIQVILVDDGSTDNSGALCDELAAGDRRITVIHQENGGLSAARNTGIHHSTGDYVMFLDSDDFLDPVLTDRMLARLEEEPDVLLGLYRNYYADGRRFENEVCDGFLRVEGIMPFERFLTAVPTDGRGCYMVAVRFIVRRSFLHINELFFREGLYHEDEEWTQRLLCGSGTILVTHEFFYQYRQDRAGAITSSVKPKHIWDTFTIMEQAKLLMGRQKPGSIQETYLKNRMAQLYLSNMISTRVLQREDKAVAYKKLEQFRPICADHMAGMVGTCVKICQKLVGVRLTCMALHTVHAILK